MRAQRGFSLVELLIAAAIALALGWMLLRIAAGTAFAAAHLDARLRARGAADRLADRLDSDAATAWSVFVPPNDVNAAPNGDGHEIDFVTQDGTHRTLWWAYAFDSAAQRVVKYSYAPGTPPVAGDAYDGIAVFSARSHPIGDLAKPGNVLYDPLFAGDGAVPVDVEFAWGAPASGGNRIVRVRVATAGTDRVLRLSSGTAPSRFTIVIDYTPPPSPAPTP